MAAEERDQRPLRPPTSFLSRIRDEPDFGIVEENIDELKRIYLGTAGDDIHEDDGESKHQLLLLDEHERNYTQAWLRRLIDSGGSWLYQDVNWGFDDDMVDILLDDAATLSERLTSLAAGANHGRGRDGGAGQGDDDAALERVFSFPFDFERLGKKRKSASLTAATAASTTSAGQQPRINVTLIDEPLPPSGNDDGAHEEAGRASSAAEAVGVQTWAAAIILADLLVCSPAEIHTGLCGDGGRGGSLNVAELGAGTGLVGIVCAQLLASQSQQQQARVNTEVNHRVVLTDYHSLVLANLRRNVAANPVASTAAAAVQMGVEALDWSHYYQQQHSPPSSAPRQQYDLLLAADVVYSPLHAQWLYAAMSSLLSRSTSARAHVVNAKRMEGRFGEWGLVRLTDEAFGPVWAEEEGEEGQGDMKLVVLKRTEMAKRKGLGRSDESGHVWWTLGWKRARGSSSSREGGATGAT